ncbi:MAG TPA: alpha-hydroxy acid oxidase [Nocardioidaceae bacterium]|nr:alpha-hydroxy acid oxidase [Nocardioidaceae bacterium]
MSQDQPRASRQVPRWSELRPLLRLRTPEFNATRRRLGKAVTIGDLRRVAKRRTPRSVFDYTDGAAEGEVSLARARAAFGSVEFQPQVLRDVSTVDPATSMLDVPARLPFAFAPTGFTRMMHHEGESAVARVAQRRGIPYALSTMGTTSIERVAEAAPGARKWFQLYVQKDRSVSEDLIRRAADSGYEALILTVDAQVPGARLRDVRNGFAIPPALTVRTIADAALHPAWWVNLLTTEPLQFATFTHWEGTIAELMATLLDPSMTLDDLEWLRSNWSGPLLVKGIQTVADAKAVVDAGADGIVLSNHGGRQLDRAPVPLRLVPEVRDAVGDRADVVVDTGIMSGADVVAAVAAGAHYALVGRAYLYGLMAGGEAGVDRAAEILETEVRRTMALLGVSTIDQLQPHHVHID